MWWVGNGEDEENLVSVLVLVLVLVIPAARNSIVVDDRPCMQHAPNTIDRYVV